MSKQLDDYGFFGPSYSFADNIALPGQIGVRQEASFDAILDAIGGVNHYVDVIAFGSSTGFDSNPQVPLGVRYFLNSGMRCTNGASMSPQPNSPPDNVFIPGQQINCLNARRWS